MAKGVSTQIHRVVPVLDAPEDHERPDTEDEIPNQKCELAHSGDFDSPGKIPLNRPLKSEKE